MSQIKLVIFPKNHLVIVTFLRQIINPARQIALTVVTVRFNVFCLCHQRKMPLTYFSNHGGVCECRVSTCQHVSHQASCVFTWVRLWSHHLAALLSGLDLMYVEVLWEIWGSSYFVSGVSVPVGEIILFFSAVLSLIYTVQMVCICGNTETCCNSGNQFTGI